MQTHLNQNIFEKIVTKEARFSAHTEQFLLLPELFQLYFPYFCLDNFKAVCCRFVVCGKELTHSIFFISVFHNTFENIVEKKKKWLIICNFSFSKIISTLLNYTFIYRDITYFFLDIFQISCNRKKVKSSYHMSLTFSSLI